MKLDPGVVVFSTGSEKPFLLLRARTWEERVEHGVHGENWVMLDLTKGSVCYEYASLLSQERYYTPL